MRRMAPFNVLMIKIQRPGCNFAATRRDWAALKRTPMPDAVPLVMLRPFGPLNFAYDVDDTTGAPLPGDHNFFRASGHIPLTEVMRVLKLADDNYIRVEETEHYGIGLAGTAATIRQLPEMESGTGYRWRVRVGSRRPPEQRFAALCHELDHIFCGHLGQHPDMP